MEQGTISNSNIMTEKEKEIESRIHRIENFISARLDWHLIIYLWFKTYNN